MKKQLTARAERRSKAQEQVDKMQMWEKLKNPHKRNEVDTMYAAFTRLNKAFNKVGIEVKKAFK